MLDERWSEEALQLRQGLADVLARHCSPASVRGFEAGDDTTGLEAALQAFGLQDLPEEPEWLLGAAWELGAALAPVTWFARPRPPGLTQILRAGRMLGAAERLLELTRAYATQRRQFGRPIGAFQAVAHALADAAIAQDAAALLTRRAVEAAAEGDVPPVFANAAWSRACRSAELVAATAHQVMGGYGFAQEYDCQLYSRRIRAWSRLGPRHTEAAAAVARALLDPTVRCGIEGLWHHDRDLPLPRWARELDRLPDHPVADAP